MEYRHVGKTGLKISEISLGAWLTYGGSQDKDNSRECVNKAIEHGINFIDIADGYSGGNAERIIGELIQEENYNRKDLVISSKVFWPMSKGVNDRGLSRKHIMESIDGTLDRLNTGYIDIYFCHRFDRYTPLEETIRTMSDLIDRGLIHYWGTSVWTAVQLERAFWMAKNLGCHPPVVEQPQYHMLNRYIETPQGVMETCKRNGMGIVCFSPLCQGVLTGKYNEGVPEQSRGATTEWLKWDLTPANIEKVKQLQPIADKLEIQMSQLALAWILRRDEMNCAITGATKPQHIASNIQASGLKLDQGTLNKIEEILNNKPDIHGLYHPPW
ncbi:MAG: aldo/keto reductase family protein [Candidatus Hodarchaeales archaeon]|jgi:voltage-dependent potassium channel beta subunit